MTLYQHLDGDCQRAVGGKEKSPCPECASAFALDGRTRAAMLAALDVEWVLLNATLREQGGGDDKDRYDLQSIVYRRNVVAAARVPSGLNASDRMWSLCPFRTANSSLVVVSHNGSMVWLLC